MVGWREATRAHTLDGGSLPIPTVTWTAPGLTLVAAREVSLAGWDAYEDAYAGAVERWAAANPDDPERDAFLERAAFFRSTWAAWRRDAMGFVTAVLRRG